VGIQWSWGLRSLHTAESTPSRTSIAHQHDRRRGLRLIAATPTVANVGALRFFAYGMQIQASEISFDLFV
jgi:hypothetical protein